MVTALGFPDTMIREVTPWHELGRSPVSCGADGRQLIEQFFDVRRRWMESVSLKTIFAENLSLDDDDDDFEMVHVPFETVGTIRVRFKEATPMKPRYFDFDEDEE